MSKFWNKITLQLDMQIIIIFCQPDPFSDPHPHIPIHFNHPSADKCSLGSPETLVRLEQPNLCHHGTLSSTLCWCHIAARCWGQVGIGIPRQTGVEEWRVGSNPGKKERPFPLCHFSRKQNGDVASKSGKMQCASAPSCSKSLKAKPTPKLLIFSSHGREVPWCRQKGDYEKGKIKRASQKHTKTRTRTRKKNKSKREPGRTGRGSQNRSCCQPNEGSYHEMGIFLWHVFMSSSCLDEKASFLHPQSPIALYCSSKRLNTWFQQIGANSCKCPPYFDFKNLAFYFTSDSQVIWIYGATPFFSRSPWRVNSFASPTSGWTSSSADVWCEVNQLDSKSSKFHQYLSLSPPQTEEKTRAWMILCIVHFAAMFPNNKATSGLPTWGKHPMWAVYGMW